MPVHLDPTSLLWGLLVGLACAAAVFPFVFLWLRLRWAPRIREDARRRSRATVRGVVTEQLVPLLGDFPFDPGDARFLGAPIDYVVFDGYSDGGEVEVVLVEVKTGRARLSAGERRVQRAVEAGRVRFEVWRR